MNEGEETDILKRDALGRVTLRRERREALLDEFERSGLKGAQFARMAGVNYATFASWAQDRRHARGEYAQHRDNATKPAPQGPKSARFLQVAAPQAMPAAQPSVLERALELHLPGGVVVRVSDAAQVPLVAQLIQSLRASC